MTVIIVGAGAAGLTAAFTLWKAGFEDFVVLEASDRLGGRVKKLENFASFPIDLGAEWIHNGLDSLGEITQDPNIIETLGIETPFSSTPDSYQAWTGSDGGFVDVEDDDWHTADDYFWKDYSWFDFFNDTVAVPQVRNSIVYNCPIESVDYSGTEGVQVECNGQTYEGSHVLITVPLKILQEGDIRFQPELPPDHQTSIQSIPFPPGFKIFLKFQENFGYENSAFYDNNDPLLLYFYDEAQGQQRAPDQHIMGCFVSDFAAEEAAKKEDEELVQMALGQLDAYFPGASPKPSELLLDAKVQNWVKEPYVRGTYTHYESDTWRHMSRLKKPIANENGDPVLYLAGEALPAESQDFNNGYAHGAALSGKESAQWILEELPSTDGGANSDADETPDPASSSTQIPAKSNFGVVIVGTLVTLLATSRTSLWGY